AARRRRTHSSGNSLAHILRIERSFASAARNVFSARGVMCRSITFRTISRRTLWWQRIRHSGSSLEPARLALERLLPGGDGFAAFFDGRFDHALVYAVSDLIDGVREVVLSLHDAQGRPNDRIAHVPLAEITLGVLDHEVEAFCFAFQRSQFVIHSHLASL